MSVHGRVRQRGAAGQGTTSAPGIRGMERAQPRTFEMEQCAREVSYLHRPGRGETLVYFHGLGGCKEDFLGAWTVEAWRRYELVAFDAPACGATRDRGARPEPGVDDVVATAEALVSRVDASGITVVGHSMGGLAGLLFATRNPGRVRRFVSVEGNLVPEDCSIYSRGARGVRGRGAQEAYVDRLVARMSESGRPGYAEAARALRRNVRTSAFYSYCRSIVRYSDDEPLLDDFVGLRVPRLFLHGDANAALPQLTRLRREGVAIASVQGSDHFPMHSNPGGYFDALVRFVEETRG